MQIFLSVLAIVLFISLVVVHEWGHYLAARRNGVDVEEFGLFFPPRLWSKKLKSGMVLSFNWLPLGGFVRLKGEHDNDTKAGSYGAASLGTKTKIMLAGVGMNLLTGLVLLTILALIGMPKLLDKDLDGTDQFTVASDTKIVRNEVLASEVLAGSPAASIGLNGKSVITNVSRGSDRRNINSVENLQAATKAFAGQTVQIEYKNGNQTVDKSVKLLTPAVVAASQNTNNPKGYLGVVPRDLQIRRSTWSAPIVAVGFTVQLVKLTLIGLGHAVGGLGSAIAGIATRNHQARENGQTNASSQVAGPVAIASILWSSGSLGINFVLMVIAVISLTLALMNILPIPALDGGRLAMTLISRKIFRKPLTQVAEERIVGASMAVLLTLILLITIVDVKRFY